MEEMEKGLKDFLDYWFSGFIRGMEEIDEASRKKVWHSCGKACAESYTIQVFKDIKKKSPDLDSFLANLSQKGSGSAFELIAPNTIRATYRQCGCDLVRLGMVKSPALCECSAANLRENLQQSLEVPVSVNIETSILRGGSQCVLVAELKK